MKQQLNTRGLLFVGKKGDLNVEAGLRYLDSLGCNTILLNPEEDAPLGSIAFYTNTEHEWNWTSHNLRAAAHRLYPTRPKWAMPTPFLVEVKPSPKNGGRNINAAFYWIALMYSEWFHGRSYTSLPWETRNGESTTYRDLMESWFDLVEVALGPEETERLIHTQLRKEQTLGRGGDVVFNRISDPSRVVLSRRDLPEGLGGNRVYRAITGCSRPVVSYGTSDVANLFELLETLKLAHHLGLPAVFETYAASHDWLYWLNGFLNPSLKVLDSQLHLDELSIKPGDKYTATISANVVREIFPKIGLASIVDEAVKWADRPLWEFYHLAMKAVADEVLRLLRIQVPYYLTTFEEICKNTLVWKTNMRQLGKELEEKMGHNVVALNAPGGKQYRTQHPLPNSSVADLHASGYWLGGSAIYDLVFSLGNSGGIVVMVKDSSAGRVNMLAERYFSPESGLYLTPVGLFRLTADGQNEDWSIDPLVFLALLREWGDDQAAFEVRKIWNAMEVPLDRAHIGRKTVATVSKGGVQIRVEDIS